MASHTIEGTTSVHTDVSTIKITQRGGIAIAALRVAMGFVFLWPFLDKTLRLRLQHRGDKSWINGGSPTKGFRRASTSARSSPSSQHRRHLVGELLFMGGLLAIGLALILGVASAHCGGRRR